MNGRTHCGRKEGLILREIKIEASGVTVTAKLNDSATADALWEALPISARAQTWGDEIYFSIPVSADEDDAQATVDMGAVGYWPPGNALCLFFGPTPMSRGDEIRPASPVNILGMIGGDPKVLKAVPSGADISVTQA